MPTATFAVQPTAWTKVDPNVCDWATDINHAYSIAQQWQEECMIWRIPNSGNPMAWVRVKEDHFSSH